MNTCRIATLAVATLTCGIGADALALTITRARIASGVVQVRGKQAAASAIIFWEGNPVAQAGATGRFAFDSTNLPADCVGEVSDGVESVDAVIQSCGPMGPVGPMGLQGDQGPAPPDISARIYNSAPISVPHNTGVTLTFDSERWDTAGLHDTANPSRLTASTAGKYLIFGEVSFATQGGGSRIVGFLVNGTQSIATNNAEGDPSHHTEVPLTTVYELQAGDYVEFTVAQDSGTTVQAEGYPTLDSPEFGMAKLP